MRNLKYFLKIYTYRRSYIIVDPCQRSARAWRGKCVAINDGKTTKKWALNKSYLTPSMSRLIEPAVRSAVPYGGACRRHGEQIKKQIQTQKTSLLLAQLSGLFR